MVKHYWTPYQCKDILTGKVFKIISSLFYQKKDEIMIKSELKDIDGTLVKSLVWDVYTFKKTSAFSFGFSIRPKTKYFSVFSLRFWLNMKMPLRSFATWVLFKWSYITGIVTVNILTMKIWIICIEKKPELLCQIDSKKIWDVLVQVFQMKDYVLATPEPTLQRPDNLE